MKKPYERTSAFAFAAALAVAAVPATMLPAAALAASASAQENTAAEQRAAAERLLASLNRQTGTIPIDVAKADLVLGDRYYFVGPDQTRSILVDIWRNPPEAADNVLGMVFPKGKSFVDDSWSAVITFERSGYVSDEDAKTIDYDALLADMRKSDEEQADSVRAQGYPAGIVQRWAQAPTYDAAKHSLVWARDIKFDGSSEDALNYDIRLLGRSGVLSMNIIAGMSQLGEVHEAARTFAQVASFRGGALCRLRSVDRRKGRIWARRTRCGGRGCSGREEGRAARYSRQVRQADLHCDHRGFRRAAQSHRPPLRAPPDARSVGMGSARDGRRG